MNNNLSNILTTILVIVFGFFLACAFLLASVVIIRDIIGNDSQSICRCECCKDRQRSDSIKVRNETYAETQQNNPYIYTPTISMF